MSIDTTTSDGSAVATHLGSMTIHGDASSFPDHASLVRTLLSVSTTATLTTIATAGDAEAGLPYGSLVAHSVLGDGSPLVCISEMAEHTRNARADGRAGMLVTGVEVDASADPLDRPRASLLGRLVPYEPSADERARHLDLHPGARDYVDFPDFGWWRLEVRAARYVGGFGHMSWVTGADLAAAAPDEVLAGSGHAVAHMNDDHADACLDMVRHLAGVVTAVSARVHSIDRHGMTLYAEVPGSPLATVRIAFDGGPLGSPEDVRPAVVTLARRAAAAAGSAS